MNNNRVMSFVRGGLYVAGLSATAVAGPAEHHPEPRPPEVSAPSGTYRVYRTTAAAGQTESSKGAIPLCKEAENRTPVKGISIEWDGDVKINGVVWTGAKVGDDQMVLAFSDKTLTKEISFGIVNGVAIAFYSINELSTDNAGSKQVTCSSTFAYTGYFKTRPKQKSRRR